MVNAVACLCDVMVVVAQVRSVHNRSSFDFFLVIDHPLSPALCPISRAIESDLLRLRLLGLRWCFCLAQPGQSCTRPAVSGFIFRLACFLLEARNHCGVERYLLLACGQLFTSCLMLVGTTLLSTLRLRLLPRPMPC